MTSHSSTHSQAATVAIIGGGPAGLMAAEALAQKGISVEVFDGMPSVGRKFLLAGKGGLNLTHAEPLERLMGRYGPRSALLEPWLREWGPQALRDWAEGLGITTFVGSSQRVFPQDMKAAPLLRAWLHRLRESGVRFHMRHRWQGWDDSGAWIFDSPQGRQARQPAAVVLALGGASWPRLGSDGAWWPHLQSRGVSLAELSPSNCGFDVDWSAHFSERFAGAPLKSVSINVDGTSQQGEFVVTAGGVEGSLIYAASAALRDKLAAQGSASFELDLLPARSLDWVQRELAHPRGTRSLSTHLKTRLTLSGVKAGLLREVASKEALANPQQLAALIKALPVAVTAPRPVAEAISSGGGVRFEGLDGQLMLQAMPGVFVAGEMLDWEAPTGGYLLTACFSTGRLAGQGAAAWVRRETS